MLGPLPLSSLVLVSWQVSVCHFTIFFITDSYAISLPEVRAKIVDSEISSSFFLDSKGERASVNEVISHQYSTVATTDTYIPMLPYQ